MKTSVAIIGAGPSGLLLSKMLFNRGIESIILENRNKNYLESRIRAGVLDFDSVQILKEEGLGKVIKDHGFNTASLRFSFQGETTLLNTKTVTNGKYRTTVRQTYLIKSLLENLNDSKQNIIWEAKAQRIDGLTDKETIIHYTLHGKLYKMSCDYVVGCDSWRGISGPTTTLYGNKIKSKIYPYSWYGLLVEDKNTNNSEVFFAYHQDGFAIKIPTTKKTSRLYIQCENGMDPDSWEDDQIWSELDKRMQIKNNRSKVLSKEVHSLSCYNLSTMQYGNLFLAGDAAHLLPIFGGKGLNLAISDVKILAEAFDKYYNEKDNLALKNYSKNCLVKNEKTTAFINSLTTIFHVDFTLSMDENINKIVSFLKQLKTVEFQEKFVNRYVNTGI
jgi:p-hydroxybenzoate 3-monooxygenase